MVFIRRDKKMQQWISHWQGTGPAVLKLPAQQAAEPRSEIQFPSIQDDFY